MTRTITKPGIPPAIQQSGLRITVTPEVLSELQEEADTLTRHARELRQTYVRDREPIHAVFWDVPGWRGVPERVQPADVAVCIVRNVLEGEAFGFRPDREQYADSGEELRLEFGKWPLRCLRALAWASEVSMEAIASQCVAQAVAHPETSMLQDEHSLSFAMPKWMESWADHIADQRFKHGKGWSWMRDAMNEGREAVENQEQPKASAYTAELRLLGLKRAHSTSKAAIRSAFRTATKEHHPDRGGNPEMMRAVIEAYEKLRRVGLA